MAEQVSPSLVKRLWKRRWVKALLLFLLLLLILFLCRRPIMRGMGAFLITEDEAVHADAIYALGGASLERGTEAARLFNAGYAPRVVCTGGNVPATYLADGIDRSEADVTRDVAIRNGVPPEHCTALERGTSTQEEAQAILAATKAAGEDTVMIVSSLFHLRRIGFVFRDRFADEGITVLLRGAPSHSFKEEEWWRYEDGLIMCQNEYVKLFYYWWKY